MNAFYKMNLRGVKKMKPFILSLLLVAIASASYAQTVVWEDNFDGPNVNTDNWTYDFGDGCERGNCGWGNLELQYYTSRNENVRVNNGNLVIEARRENFQNKPFTSGRIKSFGRVQFKYGTLEARIKVPNLKNGLWPAFWMLGSTGVWPASGEIDIMEMGMASSYPDSVNNWVSAATHWMHQGNQADYASYYKSATDLTNDYHVYKMVWTPSAIRVFIDNIQIFNMNITGGAGGDLEEFHKPQYILLNLAVGGTFTGIPTAGGVNAPLPAQMLVDYVRLTQSPGDELYIGKDNAPVDNYGVYTETTPLYDSLVYGDDAQLYYWNNMNNIPGATAQEGSQVLALAAGAGNWFGFGVENDPKYMMNFVNGSMRFHFKTTYNGQFKVGVKSGHGESWIDFPAGVNKFGLVRDGNWHEVNIPMSAFNQPNLGMHIDLGSMNSLFMFAGNAPSANTEFYFDNIYYTPCLTGQCQLLPVKLAAYDVKLTENRKVAINWSTTSEINNDRFIIERGTNGFSFEPIATVASKGNSSIEKQYTYTDNNPLNGTSFYRLVQVDKDGKRTVYDVKRINLNAGNAQIVEYPNPLKGANLNLTFGSAIQKVINVQLVDLSGKVVMNKNERVNGNSLKLTLNSKPAAGVYLLKIDGKINSKLIVE